MTINEDEFHRRVGKILRKRAAIESALELFIGQYFSQRRASTFTELIASKMTFNEKKEVFLEICKRENLEKQKLKPVKKAIERVQEIGNDVAHNEAFVDNHEQENIWLRHKRAVWDKDDRLEISDNLVKDVEDNYSVAIHGIFGFHTKLARKIQN